MKIYFCNSLDITPESRGYFVCLHNVHSKVMIRYFNRWRKAHSIEDDSYQYACDLLDDDNTVVDSFFTDEAGFRAIEERPEASSMFEVRQVRYLDLGRLKKHG